MKFNQPVPELPVKNLRKAQEFYRDILGFNIEWTHGDDIGAVSCGSTAIFLRQRTGKFEPSIHWIYAEDVDATYDFVVRAGAKIIDDIENKPWNHRQFTMSDLDGNLFHIHHDL